MEPDGNLLDSVGGDTSLANEWSLPVLPEGNSSHPSTSQELADIFGTSDDEDDVDFPFVLSSELPVPKGFEDIALAGGPENSLLGNTADSELFLAGFQPSPNKDSNDLKSAPPKKEEEKKKYDESPPESKEDKIETEEKQDGDKKEVKTDPAPAPAPALERTEDSSSTEQGPESPEKETERVVRKSARLRARHSGAESGSSSEQEITQSTNKFPETNEPKVVKEDPPKEPTAASVEGPEVVEKSKESPKNAESSSSEGSGSEDEDSEEDDPNKLYCICRQPHDDRFMICCDVCEDWFHGNCVGITVAQGKRMEREGKEYVCPICVEKQFRQKEDAAASRSARLQQREVTRERVIKKKLAAQGLPDSHPTPKRRRTVSSSTPTDGDSYGLSQLFLPDNAPAGGEVSSTSEDVKPNELISYECVISDCPNKTVPPSVYCSKECIEKHVGNSLKKLASHGVNVTSNPSEFVKGSGGIVVVEKATNKILVGICAPSEKELVPWLQAHPSYQVLIHGKGKKKSKLKSTKVKAEVKKEREEIKYPKLMDPESVRANAKKALYQILWKRHEEAADMATITQSEVETIAHDIEEKLFNLNQDINPKYKNKYRSLIFNLKDMKNQGLFRKVLTKAVTSRELVRMSSEKLASEELSAWRETTLKKNLEMIKQHEEEMGALGVVIRKITHKGEVEINSSEIGEKIIENTPTTEIPEPELSVKPETKPHSKSKSDTKTPDTKASGNDGGILSLLKNTTSEHGTGKHLYDHHCDICTGKMKAPTPSTSPQPSPDSHMHEDMDTTETIEYTSPDSVAKPLSPLPHYDAHRMVWTGSINMVGLTSFTSTAHPVSGYTDDLIEHLPKGMHLMGRIAYAQVWDYLDKIRNSGSKDVCVIHFSSTEDEKDSYISMFNYLVRKRRSGVIISSGMGTIKDMYLVPLPGHWDVPQQLLPFAGPGLPNGRGDIMLGVIVRSKGTSKLSLQPNNSPLTRIKAEVTLKRHHSSTDDVHYSEGLQRKRSKVEIGFGDQTPPSSSRHHRETSNMKKELVDDEDDDSAPYSPSKMYEDSSFDAALDPKSGGGSKITDVKKEEPKTVQMSFYGEHQPANSTGTITPSPAKPTTSSQSGASSSSAKDSSKLGDINTSAVADSLRSALNLPASANIQNLLANLSSTKLKELASAVSTLEKISDGPIDQSTLAAAGTAKLRAAFTSDGPKASNSAPPVSSNASGPPALPPLASEPVHSHQRPSQQQQFAPHPHDQGSQASHPYQAHELHPHDSRPHQTQESRGSQPFLTEWDKRQQLRQYRQEQPPPPAVPTHNHPQHPPQDGYQTQHPLNYPPQDYTPTHSHTDYPATHNEPPYHTHNDPSYHPPHPEHNWRDPRSNWGKQQQYPHEGWGHQDEMFQNSGRGFRGGFRGRGGMRGGWDQERHPEHGDRYRGYH